MANSTKTANAEISTLKFHDLPVRMIASPDGTEPLFCLADVCRAINLENVTHSANQIKDEFRCPTLNVTHLEDRMGRIQETLMITEPQLYFVMMRSRAKIAREFRQWICNEVIPSIRKYGRYDKTGTTAIPAPEPTTSELVQRAQAKLAELDKIPPLPLPMPVPVRLSTSGKSHPPYVPSLAPRYQGLTYPKLFMMLCGELKADAEQMAAFDYCLNKARQQGYAQGRKGEETGDGAPHVSDAEVAELKRRLAEAESQVSALEAQGGYLTQLRASEFLKCFKHVRDQYSDLKPMIEALRQIGANMVVWRINGCFDAMKSVELSLKPDCERVLKLKAPKEDFARVWHIKHRSSKD